MEIAIASDHQGFKLKELIKSLDFFSGIKFTDFGCYSEDSCDYPDFVHFLAESIVNGKQSLGIVICSSGNGVAITCNRYKEIRASVCWNIETARLAKEHGNSNVIALPASFLPPVDAIHMVATFIDTQFMGGKHQRRIDKINK